MLKIITVVTGASGAIYAKRFIQEINQAGQQQILLFSDPARLVISHELGLQLPTASSKIAKILAVDWELPHPELIRCEDSRNYHADIASGSQAADAMVVIPCTMGSLARFNQGLSLNLIERSFDVMLKEKKEIILVPRETPLNRIHLKNMLELSEIQVDIIPAMPAFYHQPTGIGELVDFIVGRVLEHLGLSHSLYEKWKK